VGKMSTLDFDEVLKHLGEMGPYQRTLYLMLCIPACLPAAFLAFNQVFLSAEPSHWCRQPGLDQVGAELNWTQRMHLGSPYIKGEEEYSKCEMYKVENWTQVLKDNGDKWPEEPDPAWNVTKCLHGWNYDRSEYANTLVTELDLVCDYAQWPHISTSLFYVGSLLGNIIFGNIADRFGRRTAFFLLLFMATSLGVAIAFAPNYTVFTILRSINGLTFPALFQIPFILCQEVMGPAYRTAAGMMLCMFFAVALMILAGLSYLFNSWFSLACITSFPFIALFSYWFFVPESPRWLLSTGRIDEAEVVVQKIAKWNGKDIPANFIHQMAQKAAQENREAGSRSPEKSFSLDANQKRKQCANANQSQMGCDDEEKRGLTSDGQLEVEEPEKEKTIAVSIYTMVKWGTAYPTSRRNFLLITFNWVANALVYNGLSYYSANLNVSSHLGFFISSAVEVPSYFLGWWVMDKWGRRWILFETMMIGGLSCISCIFVPAGASAWWTVGLAMIGKFQIACSFAVIYVYAGELMPTVVRSQAMGISSFVAGLGLLAFPYINSLGAINKIIPLLIMGTFSCLGGITALFLPETLFKHLPNTLEEGETFGTNFNIFSCPSNSRSCEELGPEVVGVEKISLRQADPARLNQL